MPIRVSVEEASSVLCVVATGQLMRREVGWAAERARELLDTGAATAVLVDATQAQKQISLLLSAEMISGFFAALDTDLPMAYVRPAVWSESDYQTISAGLDIAPPHFKIFTDLSEARLWLCEAGKSGADSSD